MLKKITLRILTLIFVFDSFVFAGSILNPGFENVIEGEEYDTPANWNVENLVSSVTIFEASQTSKYPGDNKSGWKIDLNAGLPAYEGSKFALLSNGPSDIYFGKITQDVTVNAGDIISGAYFFGSCDYATWYDYATIKLLAERDSGLSDIELVRIGIQDVGDFGSTDGWVTFQSDPISFSGTYTFEISIYDDKDSIYESYFAVDGLAITPEPATIMLLAGGILFFRKK
jgi:hypothetical protein